jgi:hypothetical protein
MKMAPAVAGRIASSMENFHKGNEAAALHETIELGRQLRCDTEAPRAARTAGGHAIVVDELRRCA